MTFIHEDREWGDLLGIVAKQRRIDVALVEKDYWVTHALWALHEQGFDVWFKGGTSLSKGFGLIERFSEDLDLRLDSGRVSDLADPELPWEDRNKRRRTTGIAERDAWFDAVAETMIVPGCDVRRNSSGSDERMRSAWFEVIYPSQHTDRLPAPMRPFVLLEVGRARVVPWVSRPISSWVHDHLEELGQIEQFLDNRPCSVRCIHPMVTCLEKIDAIARRFDRQRPAPDFVRHYEDVARILGARDALPVLDLGLADLLGSLEREDRKVMPPETHPAFRPSDGAQWDELRDAWAAIGPMYWGERQTLEHASDEIRSFLSELARLTN